MYTSFRVQNFRCFEDLRIDDLARVNLIAGKNNTGKTSVLEAIMLRTQALPSFFLPSGQIQPPSELAHKRFLLDALQPLEPRLIDMTFSADIIHCDIGANTSIPLPAMGEGMNRVASLVLAIGSASGGVICIDEIENGLHYSIMTDVWRAIAKAARAFDVQIFATTHSLECIRAAHEAFSQDEIYDFRYHRLDRKKTGKIEAVTFNRDMLQTAANANFEVR